MGGKKRGAAEIFFDQLRSVWMSDETLFRVFDVASQAIQ